jgi:hypothetical protein
MQKSPADMQFANQPVKTGKTLWKNPVLTGGGLNRLVGFRRFRNTEKLKLINKLFSMD